MPMMEMYNIIKRRNENDPADPMRREDGRPTKLTTPKKVKRIPSIN